METNLKQGMLRVWRHRNTKALEKCPYVLIGEQVGEEWLMTFLSDGSDGLWEARSILKESRPFWMQEGDFLAGFRQVRNLQVNGRFEVELLEYHQLDSGRQERRTAGEMRGAKFSTYDTWRR